MLFRYRLRRRVFFLFIAIHDTKMTFAVFNTLPFHALSCGALVPRGCTLHEAKGVLVGHSSQMMQKFCPTSAKVALTSKSEECGNDTRSTSMLKSALVAGVVDTGIMAVESGHANGVINGEKPKKRLILHAFVEMCTAS